MKTIHQMALVIFLLTGHHALTQDLHTMVLEVDPQSENPTNTLTFRWDDGSQMEQKTSHKSFVLNARVGDQIRWEGRPSPQTEGDVKLTQIKYLSGPRIFSKDIITGQGALQATVIRGGNSPYVYEIRFSLNNKTKEEVITSRIQIVQ